MSTLRLIIYNSFNERRNLVKFKLSNHKLMIELGRYQTDHISRENRLCPLCKSNQIENETHFLLDCSKYSSQRQTFLNRINELIPNFERKSTSESIKLLMNCNDYHVNKLVMKFISSCKYTYALLQSRRVCGNKCLLLPWGRRKCFFIFSSSSSCSYG